MNNQILYGYGYLGEFELSLEHVQKFLGDKYLKVCGKFMKEYEIAKSIGGIIFNSTGLEGKMYEFENVFFVVWSCGEYIDFAMFEKNKGE